MPHTLAQLEAFVSSPAYDAETAGLIASGIPALKAAGADGQLISPGVRRIHGNLCNVHGKYGPCDKALSGKKKPGKGRKPAKAKLTPEQRTATRDAEHQANRAAVFSKLGLFEDATAALTDLRDGKPVTDDGGLVKMGLAEQASDGSFRLTPTGRALTAAANAGDTGRARDIISRGTDAQGKRTERTAAQQGRQQAAQQRQAGVQARRQAASAERAKRQQERAAKKPAKAAAGGGKKPEKPAIEKPRRAAPAKRMRRSSAPSVGGVAGASANKKPPPPPPKAVQPAKAPAKQLAPQLAEAAQSLSDGKELSDDDTQSLIRNGLAKLDKNGTLILTAAGMRATQKEYSFRVFKDASGRYRWVAQSSTAFQDRDKEIVSTKALADDCVFADKTGSYGPLRWWHSPGLDLGDCDFNAMHGRVLIESGTFRTPAIAHKVAAATDGLEISLGFLHLPTEPDASGVFHHIRRFERSLVPRGKASNRFTAFTVKDQSMANQFTPEKIAGMKAIGFTDEDIAEFSNNATSTEKTADGLLIASKADEPAAPMVYAAPDGTHGIIQDGRFVTLKAFPPSPPTAADAVVEEDAVGDMPMDDGADMGGLTLSPEDIAAIGSAVAEQIGPAIAQVMGALDLEKKVGAHVQGLMQPYQQAQATKDAEQAERDERIAQLQSSLKAAQEQQAATQAQLNELLGLQPAVKAERASESATTTINPWIPRDAQLLESIKQQVPADQQFAFGDLVENLFGNQTPGQA